MTEVVLDASVIVKWVFPDRPGETHAERAMIQQHIDQNFVPDDVGHPLTRPDA